MGGRLKREETHAYLWLSHPDVWQRPTQYCEAIFLQLKIIKKKKDKLQDKKNDVAHIHLLTRKATYSKVGKKQVTK